MLEIHAIHGFLGLPADWNVFNFPRLHAYDLTDAAIIPSSDGLWGWAQRFNAHITSTNDILLGYSLGGRLALHALLENPAKWKAGIIISSHTGLQSEREKNARIHADTDWAKRFETESWESVVGEWNDQPVFGGIASPFIRQENQFSRKHLGHLLRHCSCGYQDDLSVTLQNIQLPILWISGQLDIPYRTAAKALDFSHPLSRVEIVESAGHRVPWEQPEKFLKLTQSFINEVLSCL